MAMVEMLGYVGGLWLVWDSSRANVEVLSMNNQCITALVHENGNKSWLFTMLYASPRAATLEDLWNHLCDMWIFINISWVVMGDVNQPLDDWDKKGAEQ